MKHRVMGIRAEESANRAARPRIDLHAPLKQRLYKPIFHWQEWHVWEFIDAHSLPYPCLYDEGFDRIGCVICPFLMGKNQARVNWHKARWPGYYKVFEKVTAEWFAAYRTKPRPHQQKTPEEYLAAYYRGFE